MSKSLDYPAVGVCPWKEWSQEAACWINDPRNGSEPISIRTWRRLLRIVRQQPFRTNPWRQCFARANMLPREAYLTIRGQE